jgi:hypothetical protein
MPNNLQRAMDTSLRSLNTTKAEQQEILRFCLEGRKMKHKLSVAFIVTMILILLAATALAVTALTGHLRFMNPEDGPQPLSCTVMDDTLYIMTNDGLMRWQPADAVSVKLVDDQRLLAQHISIDALLFHTDGLMLLDTGAKMIWRYVNGQFEEALNLSRVWTQFGRSWLGDPVAMGGYLFVRAVEEDAVGTEAVLWRIDLSTGEAYALDVPGIVELTAYRNGELLALQYDMAGSETILSIDAQSGGILERIVSVPLLEIEGIAYSADRDAIYAMRNGTLSQWNGSRWVSMQTATVPVHSFFFSTIGDGYVAAGHSGVQFLSLDAAAAEPTLVIRGWSSPYGVEDAFVQAHPGVQIQREKLARFSGTDVAKALESGDASDLFYVRLDAAVFQLIRDGLLAPLSQSGILTADIARMLPQIQTAVAPSGTPYVLPEILQIPLWMIRNDAANEPPGTILELISQDIAWNAEPEPGAMYLANDYNAVPWTKQDYARYALQQAYDEAAAAGQTPDFSVEEFSKFLETLKGAELSAAAQPSQSSVVTANSFYMLRGRTSDEARLQRRMMEPPAVTTARTDAVPSTLIVYALNPESKNMRLALDFLEYVAQNRNAGEQALLCPDTAEPSLYAYARDYEDLHSLPESWEVTADALAVYKTDVVPRLSVSLSPYTPNQSLMLETVTQYLDDEITLEQCTVRLNALAANPPAEGD